MINLSACKYCGKLYEPQQNGYACPSCTAPTPHDWKPPENEYYGADAARQPIQWTTSIYCPTAVTIKDAISNSRG